MDKRVNRHINLERFNSKVSLKKTMREVRSQHFQEC